MNGFTHSRTPVCDRGYLRALIIALNASDEPETAKIGAERLTLRTQKRRCIKAGAREDKAELARAPG